MNLRPFFRIMFVALFALMFYTSVASAQSRSAVSKSGRVHESWYMYWAIGYSFPQYPDGLQEALDDLDEFPGVGRITLNVDALGFYWPVFSNSSVLGVVLNGVNDVYSADVNNSLSVTQGLVSASFMHSLTDIIGDGLTVRADIGLATLSSEYKTRSGNTTSTTRSDSEIGFGFLVGAGYALPVSSQTSLTFGGHYAVRLVDGDSFSTATVSLGVFF